MADIATPVPEVEATITVTTGDTAPANPEEGNLWFCCDDNNANNARLYVYVCLLYTSPSPRDRQKSRMPSSA